MRTWEICNRALSLPLSFFHQQRAEGNSPCLPLSPRLALSLASPCSPCLGLRPQGKTTLFEKNRGILQTYTRIGVNELLPGFACLGGVTFSREVGHGSVWVQLFVLEPLDCWAEELCDTLAVSPPIHTDFLIFNCPKDRTWVLPLRNVRKGDIAAHSA